MSNEVLPAPEIVVDKDGQVLQHTTSEGHRRARRRIVRPRAPADEPPSDADSTDTPAEPAAATDPMQRIVERVDARSGDVEVPEVEFVTAEGGELPPPPMEPRAGKREEPSTSEILLTDDPQPPRSLEDLSGFDLGDQYYIQVIRKEPKIYGGRRVDGRQKEIRRRMDTDEFSKIYGGLTYELTLYGPPKKGPVFDAESKPIYRQRCKPFIVTIPGSPPNPATCIGYDAEEDFMISPDTGRPRPGVATTADARIHETDLEHKREMDLREERRRRERRDELRERDREREREVSGTAQAMADMHRSSMDNQASMYRTLTDTQTDMINKLIGGRPGASEAETRYLHESVARVQQASQEYINRLNENHSAQIERLTASHAAELARVDTAHRAELSRLQDQVVAERARSETIVRDAERQFGDRLREAEKRADKEVSDARRELQERSTALREDFNSRLTDQSQRHTDRYNDLKDNHERDLKNRDAKWEMQLASERSSFDAKFAVKEHEIKLLREENARLREEANKPIHEKVREITETAEALGMRRAEDVPSENEPQTWQQMLLQMGVNGLQNLPSIISSAGEAVARLREGGTAAQQTAYVRQAQEEMRAAAAAHPARTGGVMPRAFALDGENDFQSAIPGPMVMHQPMAPAPLPPAMPAAAPPPAPSAVQAAAAPLTPEPRTTAPPATSVAPPSPSSLPPAPAPAPGPAVDPSLDPLVLQYQEAFEKAMAAGTTPKDLADYLMKTFSAPVMAQVVPMISAESVRTVLQRNGKQGSPLCFRQGQKYLRALKAELEDMIKAA